MELVENRNNIQKKMYYYVDIELIYESLIISIRRESLDGVRRKMDTENICDEVLSSDDKTKKKRSRRNMPFATMPASECTIVHSLAGIVANGIFLLLRFFFVLSSLLRTSSQIFSVSIFLLTPSRLSLLIDIINDS